MNIFKKIKELINKNLYLIGCILIIVSLISTSNAKQRNSIEFCTDKCDELGYDYFDSTPPKFFGLKSEDCKCKDNTNQIIDIK